MESPTFAWLFKWSPKEADSFPNLFFKKYSYHKFGDLATQKILKFILFKNLSMLQVKKGI